MTSAPLVSVFMPVYNQAAYVAESLESVLGQDYGNFEIVVGDDCSVDNSWEIIAGYAARYPGKVVAFRNEQNLGITGNCNEILKRCRGKYISFLAGDDIALQGKLRIQVDWMEENSKHVMCYHDVEVFGLDSCIGVSSVSKVPGRRPVSGGALDVAKAIVRTGNEFIPAISVMARRDAMPPWGFVSRLPVNSDAMMWLEICARNPEAVVGYMNKRLAGYRRTPTSVTVLAKKSYREQFAFLSAVESDYPFLRKEVLNCRGYYYYLSAIQDIRDGNWKQGRSDLLSGVRQHLYRHDWLIWWLYSWALQVGILKRK